MTILINKHLIRFYISTLLFLLPGLVYSGEANTDVQVQDNGWIKIVDQYVEETPAEEFYGELYKDLLSESRKGTIVKMLNVKIMFLKYAKAESYAEEYVRENKKTTDPNELIPLSKEMEYLISATEALENENYEKAQELQREAKNKLGVYFSDLTQPEFRSNYRFKVFLECTNKNKSKFKEFNTSTKSQFPKAERISESRHKREMLPGETMWVVFSLGDAESWRVWIPK